jgi:hypothetical protein
MFQKIQKCIAFIAACPKVKKVVLAAIVLLGVNFLI